MGKMILIVEDNENNRNLLKDILIFHGYDIAEADSGNEAIALARELMPDLIMMDIQMPEMDGITATGILKRDPLTKKLKIIALTSFAMQGDREKFFADGFDGYLSKPFDTRKLPSLVKKWLEVQETSNNHG